MSSFFIYYNQKNPLPTSQIEKISGGLRHYSWTKTKHHSVDNLLIVESFPHHGIKIFTDTSKKIFFILQGDIFHSDNGLIKKGATLEDNITHLYLEKGIEACVGLNGTYNLFVWNSDKRYLETASDRMGLRQAFYSQVPNGFVLTSNIFCLKYLPDLNIELDQQGIFDLLSLGTAYEDRTLFKNVIRLLPNSCYRIQDGKLHPINTFFFNFTQKRWGQTILESLDGLEHYYTQAIKRQFTPENKILFLQSGGKDSRILSLMFKKSGITPDCVTAGENHFGEVFLTKDVDQILDFPWKKINISQDFDMDYSDLHLKMNSASSMIYVSFFIEIINQLRDGWDFSTAGLFADTFTGSTIMTAGKQIPENPQHAFQNYFQHWRNGLINAEESKKLFPGKGKQLTEQYELENLKLFLKCGNLPYQMILGFGLRTNNRFKVGSAFTFVDAGISMRLPCLDIDFQDFIFSLPPNMLFDRFLLDLYLIHRGEKINTIPLDKNSWRYEPLVRAFKSELKYKIKLNWINNILIPCLKKINPVHATNQSYVSLLSMDQRGSQRMLKDALKNAELTEGLMDVDAVKSILSKPADSNNHITSSKVKRSLIAIIKTIQFLRG